MTTSPTVADLEHQVEELTDQLAEASLSAQSLLSADDLGWASLAGDSTDLISREAILKTARVGRVMVVADPLIKRGVSIRVAYLGTPSISAATGDDEAGQDVNAVIQAFWDDPSNTETLTSAQACEERERERATDGNTFHALVTSPRTGRVQVRRIPFEQVQDVITDPDDAATRWLYLRQWTQRVVEQGYTGLTRSRTETRRAYYPDVTYRPATRPRSIDGIPVYWDRPIVHTEVNRPSGSRWGVPDVLAAIPWAKGYKDALQDMAKHNKALAVVAYKASVQGRRGAAAVRERMPMAPGEAGQTAIVGAGNDLTAVNKTGAALDGKTAEPLAGLVAAALDVPKTMLLADPGVTGARATAETLDRPLENDRLARRRLDTDMLVTILEHVVREAVRAPAGPLRGVVTRDPDTGRELVTLTGGQEPGIVVDWPDLSKVDPAALMETIAKADGMDVVPPEIVARLVMLALGIDDVDEVIDAMRDDDGTFIPPSREQAHTDATAGYDDGDGRPTPAEQEESLWPSPPTP